MNISEAIKTVKNEYAMYFRYKFPDMKFDKSKPAKTEEEFLKTVGRKSMNGFERWEKTDEYKMLVTLYLNTKVIKDYQEIYNIVSEQAKKGEEKYIKLFFTLNKELQTQSKMASSYFVTENAEEEDDLSW